MSKHVIYHLREVDAPTVFELDYPKGYDPRPVYVATNEFLRNLPRGDSSGYPEGVIRLGTADMSKHTEFFEEVIVKRKRAFKQLPERTRSATVAICTVNVAKTRYWNLIPVQDISSFWRTCSMRKVGYKFHRIFGCFQVDAYSRCIHHAVLEQSRMKRDGKRAGIDTIICS